MKKIIFDMGGTLIDFHKGQYADEEKDKIGLQVWSALLKESYDITMTAEALEQWFLKPWLNDFPLREQLKELDFKSYLCNAIEHSGYNANSVDALLCMYAYYDQYIKDAQLNEGVYEVLKQLKLCRFTIHVLSNCILSQEVYIQVFENLEIDQFIDHYTFSYNVGVRKPHLSLFQKEVKGIDIREEAVYFVGDNFKVDIMPALNVGMKGIWYNPTRKRLDVDFKVESIRNFSELLDKLKI